MHAILTILIEVSPSFADTLVEIDGEFDAPKIYSIVDEVLLATGLVGVR